MGAMIKGYRSMHAKGVEALSLSGAERRARVKAFEDEIVESKNVLVGLLMPALSGVVKWDDRINDLSGMFKIVLRHGSSLDEKKLDGTTFSLAKDENGNVELGASESDANLPLSSTVGGK